MLSADHLNCSGWETFIDAEESGKSRERIQQQSTLIAQAPQIYPLQRPYASFKHSEDPEVWVSIKWWRCGAGSHFNKYVISRSKHIIYTEKDWPGTVGFQHYQLRHSQHCGPLYTLLFAVLSEGGNNLACATDSKCLQLLWVGLLEQGTLTRWLVYVNTSSLLLCTITGEISSFWF